MELFNKDYKSHQLPGGQGILCVIRTRVKN